MKGIKVEGIILKRKNYGEADRILTVFTLQKGKITILARGIRKITSRRAGNVELLNQVVMYLHPGKNFYLLTEATAVETYQDIKGNLAVSTYAYHIIELVNRLLPENVTERLVYSYLLAVLRGLNTAPRQILIRAFEVKILSLLGFAHFSAKNQDYIHEDVRKILSFLESKDWVEIKKLELKADIAQELERILNMQIESVLESSLRSLKTLKDLRSNIL